MKAEVKFRTNKILIVIAVAVTACATTPWPPQPRPTTTDEDRLLAEMRRDGIAILMDGCIFADDVANTRNIALAESATLAGQVGQTLKQLAEGNGIAVKAMAEPFVCASHTHLGTWNVANTLDGSATRKSIPMPRDQVPEMPPPGSAIDPATRAAYLALLRWLNSARTTTPLKADCKWCWNYFPDFAQPPDRARTPTPDQADRLLQVLGSRWVLITYPGGFVQTGGQVANNNVKAAGLFLVSLLIGRDAMRGAGGRHDTWFEEAAIVDLTRLAVVWSRHGPAFTNVQHRHPLSPNSTKNGFYPLFGMPATNCKAVGSGPRHCED